LLNRRIKRLRKIHQIFLPVENVGLLGSGSDESDLYFAGSLVSNKTTEPSCYSKKNFLVRRKERK
jgi:hypothetical protein